MTNIFAIALILTAGFHLAKFMFQKTDIILHVTRMHRCNLGNISTTKTATISKF